MKAAHESQVFISYSRRDSAFVDRLYARLIACGTAPWIDRVELRAGDSLLQRLASAVSKSTYVLAVLSPASVSSRWVQKELEIASHLELEEGTVKVVPVLRRSCEFPIALRPKLYLDFTRPSAKHFESSFQKLLLALDAVESTDDDLVVPSQPDIKLFPELLADALADPDDVWFQEFKQLPLTRLLERAVKFRSFSGDAKAEIADGLVMVSNVPRISFSNLVVFLGFLKNLDDLSSPGVDAYSLLKSLVENPSLAVDYRWFAIKRIPKHFEAIRPRSEKLRMLPNIFPSEHFDPLADRLISEFFTKEEGPDSLVGELLTMDAPQYRREIIDYIVKIGKWRNGPPKAEKIDQIRDPRQLRKQLGMSWLGMDDKSEEALKKANWLVSTIEMESSLPVSNMGTIIETLARSCPDSREVFSVLVDILSPEVLARLCQAQGTGPVFDVTVQVVTSPFVDCLTSAFALFSMIEVFGLGSLKHHGAFPAGLMRQKPNPFTEPATLSILECLIDASQSDPLSGTMVESLLELFPKAPFLAFASMKCKCIPSGCGAISKIMKKISKLDNGGPVRPKRTER